MSKYIDADALKTKFKYSDADTEDEKIWTATMRRMIDETPAADVEPVRHGHWINTHDRLVKCSLCGKSVQTNWRGFYCQNCGAKMGGGEWPDTKT